MSSPVLLTAVAEQRPQAGQPRLRIRLNRLGSGERGVHAVRPVGLGPHVPGQRQAGPEIAVVCAGQYRQREWPFPARRMPVIQTPAQPGQVGRQARGQGWRQRQCANGAGEGRRVQQHARGERQPSASGLERH
ncbi:MAG: hypothetical protein KatS3mg057_1661 [Herpetosiphonaceae bacterium]|nr:MAG: hypothetical protein KatS3mg057_1661 [Herpetosiphonaceae bacterium]